MPTILPSARVPVIGNGASVTVSTPLLNLTQAWNNAGTTFTGLLANITDTASASGSLLLDLQVGGASKFSTTKGGDGAFSGSLRVGSQSSTTGWSVDYYSSGITGGSMTSLNWTSGSPQAASDTGLSRPSAGIIAAGNGTQGDTSGTLQAVRFLTSATGTFVFSGNANLASTGNGVLQLQNTNNTNNATITVGASNSLTFQGSATFGAGITANTSVTIGNGQSLATPSRGSLTMGSSSADGNALFTNNAGTGWGLLQFGGTTSSFPAWKRVNATLAARLADDSADAAITMAAFTASGLATQSAGQVAATRTITAAGAVTMTTADYFVLINKTVGAATTVNLPANTNGQHYVIIDAKGDAGTNNITITPPSGTINGAATFVMNVNRQTTEVVGDGTNWNVF